MSKSVVALPALTPSEVVYLRTGSFVPRAARGQLAFKPPLGGPGVALRDVGVLAWTAALLGAEQAGNLRMISRPGAVTAGPPPEQRLYAKYREESGCWPAPSLEELISALAFRLAVDGSIPTVSAVVAACFPTVVHRPFQAAADMLGSHLSERGLLGIRRRRWFGLITLTHYRLTEMTMAQSGAAVPVVQGLLAKCQAQRPDYWRLILAQVEAGIVAAAR
jgi:hypothetical protein